MTYKDFLLEIGIKSNLSWNFCYENTINNEDINGLLNNIAFSFLSKESKLHLYSLIRSTKLDDSQAMKIEFLIKEEFSEIFKKYPIKKILVEKFVDNLLDWIEISCNDIREDTINNILNNIKSKNTYFWYILAQKLYDKSNNNESLMLIEKVKVLFDENYLYEDLVLLEVKIIRRLDYINDENLLKKLCKSSKVMKNYSYEKIILKLECSLLKQKNNFNKIFKKYFIEIESFSIGELLNVYELSILSENEQVIDKINYLLLQHNIYEYQNLEELDIYLMLKSFLKKDYKKYLDFRKELELDYNYDFRHINWYLQYQPS